MEVALTLVSIASFFALVVSWAILPTTEPTSSTAHSAAPAQAS